MIRKKEPFETMVKELVRKVDENTRWRQRDTINLIPSEQTPSTLVRLLSITDPSGRYAEHKRVEALNNAEVYYYQGTKTIREVEQELIKGMKEF